MRFFEASTSTSCTMLRCRTICITRISFRTCSSICCAWIDAWSTIFIAYCFGGCAVTSVHSFTLPNVPLPSVRPSSYLPTRPM